MAILGITGLAGSGKDTVAKMIQYYFAHKNESIFTKNLNVEGFLEGYAQRSIPRDSGWQIRKFASKLKELSAIALNCRVEDFESQEFKDSVMPDIYQTYEQDELFERTILTQHTYRWFLQHFADHLKILLGKDYFANELFSTYKQSCKGYGHTIEDVTGDFPNWLISDLRYTKTAPEEQSIKERGGKIIRVTRPSQQNTSTHPSETELFSIKEDYIILNDGTIEDLYEKVKIVLNKI